MENTNIAFNDSDNQHSFSGIKLLRAFGVILFALLLSVFTVAVYTIRTSGISSKEPYDETVFLILEILIYFGMFLAGWKILDWFDKTACASECSSVPDSDGLSVSGLKQHFLFSWKPGSVVVTAALLFLLFLPYLIVFYPGVCSYDTTNQIKDYVSGTMPIEISWNAGEPTVSCFLNDHHPVTDTFIFVFFTEYIGSFVGSTQGAFYYCLLQSILTALFLSLMLCRMEKMGIPYLYRKIGFLYLGLAPFIALYSIGMLKDSIHSLFYITYFLIYVLIIREGVTHSRMFLLFLLSLLLCVTKKTGLYLILICDIALIFLPSIRRQKAYLAEWAAGWLLPAFVLMFLMPNILFPKYNIFPGGKQESLGFTMQMTAQTYLDHKKELSADEIRILGNVMDLEKVEEEFSSYNYDSVKHHFNFDVTQEQLSEYKVLWIKLFIRYPKSGIKALFGTAGGFFSPTERIRVYFKFAKNKYTNVIAPKEKEPLRQAFQLAYEWLSEQHGIGLLLQCVLYMWWLPLGALIRILLLPAFKGRRMSLLLCMLPTAVSVLILWVSPYSMGRYGLPILYTLPLVMGLGSCSPAADFAKAKPETDSAAGSDPESPVEQPST